MSEQLTVIQALARVAEDVRSVRKDSKNSAQHFNFRGIDAVMNAVGPAFRKHGVICVPVTEDVSLEPMPLSSGKNATRCIVRVRYEFYGPSGDCVAALVCGESFDMGDKALAKAYSVALRTCLLQTLTIPTDDPDPDEQTFDAAPTPAQRVKSTRRPANTATRDAVDAVHARLASLPESKLQDYGQFREKNGIPKLSESITPVQLELIITWLNEEGF